MAENNTGGIFETALRRTEKFIVKRTALFVLMGVGAVVFTVMSNAEVKEEIKAMRKEHDAAFNSVIALTDDGVPVDIEKRPAVVRRREQRVGLQGELQKYNLILISIARR